MRAEDLKRIYELKNEPKQLSVFLDELSQNESDWDEILLTVIASAAPDMLIVLFDVSLERVQKGRCLNQWHHLLQVLTANGFRASYKDRAAYTHWLTKLTENLNTICELKTNHPNNLFPQPKSIILCYCLFHYLETFTMITENTKSDECRGMETTLLKLISNNDESLLLFPFCYLFWDNINVFTGSHTSNLPIPQLVNVNYF